MKVKQEVTDTIFIQKKKKKTPFGIYKITYTKNMIKISTKI